jgi:transcriptional regulator with XRE-family HTH domain
MSAAPASRRVEGLGPRLAALRKRSGRTQYEVAQELGLRESQVSHWETGTRSPSGLSLVRLAGVLGCTTDEILRPPECSICRRRHGPEVQHACE